MDLNAGQTRRFLLSGGIPFPCQFPNAGTISLDEGQLTLHPGAAPVPRDLLIVQESTDRTTTLTVFLREDVRGFFVPGTRDEHGGFHISYEPCVDNFESGEWFVDRDVSDLVQVRHRLGLPVGADISSRDSVLRGIAFVPEEARSLQISEVASLAGKLEHFERGRCYEKTCCK